MPARRTASALVIRVVSAAVLLGVLLGALAAGTLWVAIALGALLLVGISEFYLITRKMGYAAAPWVLFPLTLVLFYRQMLAPVGDWVVPAAISLAIVAGLVGYLFVPRNENAMVRWALAVGGSLYLGWSLGFYLTIYTLHDPDPGRVGLAWLVALAGSTMLGDTAALLVGTRYGRHRFFPRISPKKSVEGAIGGFVVQTATFAGLALLADVPLVHGFALGALVAVAAQAGDLVESQFKRSADLKDASTFVPGHGGMLDRMDSLILIPGVAYYYLILVLHVSLPQ
jgi:phosphatidate cytidylyltransferase